MITKRVFNVLVGILFGISSGAIAAVSEQEAAKLGKELTPVGAERAGNADKSLPEWTGGETQAPAGWAPGKPRHAAWPHMNEAPLYTIDASNADQYADLLSEGQKAMLKTVPGYKMHVYPSRRTCGFPDFIYERTKQNAVNAKLSADGNKLEEGIGAAVLFPVPKSGKEVIWNHKLRYMGEGFFMPHYYSYISPAKGNNAWVKLHNEWYVDLPFHRPDNKGVKDAKGIEMAAVYDTFEPQARIGEKLLYKWYINEDSKIWLYFPGQRRVRRLPTYTYDAPILGNENTKVVDQFFMFSGQLDRYDWKLVGKQELLVPYNSFKAYDFTAKEESLRNPDHFPRDLVRYEKHRVWVVEATVAEGKRHTMPKRRFYIDEDSWHILVVDHFDAEGKIWRSSEAHPIPVWELGACVSVSHVDQDLQTLRWVVDATIYAGGSDIDWNYARDGKMKSSYFTVQHIRRAARR